jgi:chaperonin GroES
VLDDGGRRPMAVATGNTVLFGKYAGTEIKLNGEELLVMRESDILGILDA